MTEHEIELALRSYLLSRGMNSRLKPSKRTVYIFKTVTPKFSLRWSQENSLGIEMLYWKLC